MSPRLGSTVLVLLMVLSGCSAAGTSATPTPTGDPLPSGFVAPTTAPEGYRDVATGDFTASVPSAWKQRESAGRAGAPATQHFLPDDSSGAVIASGPRLFVVVEPNATAGLLEQSQVLIEEKRQKQATGITRTPLEWPSADQALLVGWDEPGQRGTTRYRQLMLRVGTKLVSAVAAAPAESFDQTELNAALATVRLAR